MISSAFAMPPMKSNDPFVPNLGQYELNFAYIVENSQNSSSQARILDFNYGIIKNVQVTFETAYVINNTIEDLDAFEVSMKWLAYQGTFFSFAVEPKYKFFPYSSAFDQGDTFGLSIPMSFQFFSKLVFMFDPKIIFPSGQDSYIELGNLINYQHNVHNFFFEIYLTQVPNAQNIYLVKFGYAYQIRQNFNAMISYAEPLFTNTALSNEIYTGLQIIF